MPPSPNQLPDLTPAEVAAMVGKSRNAIMAAIKVEELRAMDLRNTGSPRPRYRVRPEWVAAWLESRRVRAVPASTEAPRSYAPPGNGVFARERAAEMMKPLQPGNRRKG